MNFQTRQLLFYLLALSPVIYFIVRIFWRYVWQECTERMEFYFALQREKRLMLGQAKTLRAILAMAHNSETIEAFPLQMEPDDIRDMVDRYYNILRQVYAFEDCPYGRNEFGFCRWMEKHGYDFE